MKSVALVLILQTIAAPSTPKWQGGVAFDSAVRDALRAPVITQRKAADDVSTILLATMVGAPFITAGARTLAARGSWKDLLGLSIVNAEAFAVAFGAMYAAKIGVARERPYATNEGLATYCTTHATDPSCSTDRNASFFSGHSAMAFTGAGLLCTQQIFFGPRGADLLGCAGGMAIATATAALRIVADMHYASDTITGAAIGLGAGMLLPYLLHFAPFAPFPLARKMRVTDEVAKKAPPLIGLHVSPFTSEGGGGLAIGAQFQ